jgi:hypothetical protein
MWKIISENNLPLKEFSTLSEAMLFAKGYGTFVTITNGEMEFVGKFGVDSVEDGKCPDGIAYDWNKASRIGRSKHKEIPNGK